MDLYGIYMLDFTSLRFNSPRINFLVRTDGDEITIQVTATIPRQANRLRSMLTKSLGLFDEALCMYKVFKVG